MNGFFGEFNRMLDRFLTPAVKTIFLINVVITLALIILGSIAPGFIEIFLYYFAQSPWLSVKHGFIWQFVTYMFVHVEIMHLVFNMLALWFFAPPLEERWGTKTFWRFYLTTGVGAGVLHAVIALLTGYEMAPIIGASGAIYGVLLAYAAYYPDSVMLIYGVFPMKAKHVVIMNIFLIFLFTSSGRGGNVSNLTHLTGLGVAYVFLALRHKSWDIRRWQWR